MRLLFPSPFPILLLSFAFSMALTPYQSLALDWIGDCTRFKDENEIKACECKKKEVIITGKYQLCAKDDDCQLLPGQCGGWVTFNKLYLKELMWITEEPEIIAATDTRPSVICFRKKCIKVAKEKE